ncbi:hypothetical protein, partial [Pseudomonas syringae group genomosp. 7]|uniref:hypothetical protein n=1 Tax=Pseudomonas syringae group genomosp. 7 TaxID=251699 RepID=UPI00376F69EF
WASSETKMRAFFTSIRNLSKSTPHRIEATQASVAANDIARTNRQHTATLALLPFSVLKEDTHPVSHRL